MITLCYYLLLIIVSFLNFSYNLHPIFLKKPLLISQIPTLPLPKIVYTYTTTKNTSL